MPATDNSAVQITINVVDGATGETISRVTKGLDQLGEAGARNGQKLKQGMQEVGKAGEAVGPAVGKGTKEAGGHLTTSLDQVRLVTQEFGIRIPRAMETVIARSQAIMGALNAVGGVIIALGAVEVFLRSAEAAYKFYQKVSDVNAAMRKYSEEAGKASSQKLFETQSIEEVNALLRQTDGILESIDKKRRGAGVGEDNSGSIMQFVGRAFASFGAGVTPDQKTFQQMHPAYTDADSARKAEALSQKDLLRESSEAIAAKRAIDLQQTKAAEDGLRLTGRAADAAAKRNAIILAQLKQTQQLKDAIFRSDSVAANNALIKRQNPKLNDDELHKIKGYEDVPVVAKDIGSQEAADAVAKARGEADAKNSRRSQEDARETRHIVAEAGMSGLEGEQLFLAKKIEALQQLKEKAAEVGLSQRDYEARRSAIDQEFFQAQTKRMRDEDARASEMEAGANVGGKTGLAKLDAERDAKLKKFQDEASAGKYTNVDMLGRYTAATNQEHDAEAGKAQEDFTERLTNLDAGRSDRYASESERITQSAQKTVREISKAWDDLYGKLDVGDSRRVQGQQALNDEIVKINADAARQRQEAGQRVEDETRKLEDQARRQGLPKYQQETAAIVDDYNERIQKLEELRAKDAANADRYRRQEIAEEQIKNGKLIEQQRALRDQLAGKLQGFFSNPLEALKRQGEQAASQYAAQLLLGNHVTRGAATAIAIGGKGGDGALGLPSIFGSGWGGKHPAHADAGASQAGSGTRNDNPLAVTTRDLGVASNTTMLTASNAIIHVGSATFAGAVTGGAGVGGSASGLPASYAPIGGGAYFNTGSAGGSSGATFSPDAGSGGGGTAATIGAGIGKVASSFGDADQDGIFNEAGASAANTIGGVAQAGTRASAAGGSQAGVLIGSTVTNGLGVYSAFEGKGGVGGALSGGLSGAKLGAEFGGPAGLIIGAGIGAVLGFIGHGARVEAQKYNFKTVRPRIANDLRSFEAGQSDYQSMFDDLSSLRLEAKQQTKQFGHGGVSYYNDTILPELKVAQQRLTREQKAGRSQFGMTAAQYHQGGIMRDFGSMATSENEGWFHGIKGEAVLNQQAAMRHADAAMLMNSGASRSDMAAYYGDGGGTRAAEGGGGGDVHLHVHAIDTRGVKQFFDDNKHSLRDSLNASYAENSGGGDYA